MTRTGKIARLPAAIRDHLNRRLLDNEPGPALLDWLNALPEVSSADPPTDQPSTLNPTLDFPA